jgi:tetratricopeptide (TPR) repeat protein
MSAILCTHKPMRHLLAIVAVLLFAAFDASAATLDQASAEKFINELAPHARYYPPQFESPAQRELMLAQLREMLPSINAASDLDPEDPRLLFLKAYANSMGHNLDLSGCAQLAIRAYGELIALRPQFRQAYYYFGGFLAGTKFFADSIPYLQKAIQLGETDAHYTLALVYLMQKDAPAAVAQFKTYLLTNPDNALALKLVAAIESGKDPVGFQFSPLPPIK